jgi:hypothetical protein
MDQGYQDLAIVHKKAPLSKKRGLIIKRSS